MGLNTCPVGWLEGNGPAGGTVTGEIATGEPSPFKTRLLPAPSAETHAGPEAGNDIPNHSPCSDQYVPDPTHHYRRPGLLGKIL